MKQKKSEERFEEIDNSIIEMISDYEFEKREMEEKFEQRINKLKEKIKKLK